MNKLIRTAFFTSVLLVNALNANIVQEKVTLHDDEVRMHYTDNDKVLVDCSNYKKKNLFGFIGGMFESKQYSEYDELQDFMEALCKNRHNNKIVVPVKELEATIKKQKPAYITEDIVIKNHSLYEKSFINDEMLKKSISGIYYRVIYDNESIYREDEYDSIKFPFVEFSKDTELQFNFKREWSDEKRKQEKTVKIQISYDFENNQISNINFQEPVNIKTHLFTNTYNIDEIKECIDGRVWIKKYGKMSGDKCPWKEKN